MFFDIMTAELRQRKSNLVSPVGGMSPFSPNAANTGEYRSTDADALLLSPESLAQSKGHGPFYLPPPLSSDRFQQHLYTKLGDGVGTTTGREDWVDHLIRAIFRYDRTTVITTAVLTLVSFITRMWNISAGNFVVWDEAHFGKFGSHYLKRDFYFDVHPPLGKILVGFGGALANYRGDFEFKSGEVYPDTLNYTVMRVFLASFGAMMVPFAHLTAIELGMSRKAAILAAVMVLCDNAFLTISRYILLDSMLLLFTVTTFFCLAVFHNCRTRPFSVEWWLWLVLTGCSIGTVSSVKWVGFFVTALVGLYTVEDLWRLLGDLAVSKLRLVHHLMARVFGLILVPATIYLFSFWLHFAILVRSGPGDAQMSSLFQAQLLGNNFHQNPLEVAYGSRITLKNNGYGGGLLHSHVQAFPHGSEQQQVTCYHHKDSNNDWEVFRLRADITDPSNPHGETPQFLKHGDRIRLLHKSTGRNLHSHPIAAPITKTAWEVSGYGNLTIGDENDYWQVEVVDDIGGQVSDRVRSLTTRLRLRHVKLNCLLRSHNVNLPEWGFKQAEVVCDKRADPDDPYNLWNVEQHWNDKLPPGTPESYRTSFIHDFIHLNVAMLTSNNALVPDPDKEPDQLASKPSQWPLMSVGLRMCGWEDNKHKVYLLGNPVVWWGGTMSLLLFGAVWFFYVLRQRRGCHDWELGGWEQFQFVGKWSVLGWLLHFVPFAAMSRVTYLHHYFPALYFSIVCFALMVDHVASYVPRVAGTALFLAVGATVVGVFAFFAPLSYGFDGPASAYADRKWVSSWNLY